MVFPFSQIFALADGWTWNIWSKLPAGKWVPSPVVDKPIPVAVA
jgi:hypothetical protein